MRNVDACDSRWWRLILCADFSVDLPFFNDNENDVDTDADEDDIDDDVVDKLFEVDIMC